MRPFSGSNPALDAVPLDTWRGIVTRCARRAGMHALGTGDAAGYGPLRETIADYLSTSRGVICSPRQVVILTSSQQALARVLRRRAQDR
ncbi:MAG: hypothetical protein ACRD2Z_06890 [Thermoanaerobaculia bacterium]